MKLENYIESIPDFPKKGLLFRDVTPILESPEAFREVTDRFKEFATGANKIVGPDARGFLFGAPLALELGLPFVPVRKKGKLPRKTLEVSYDLEYGSNILAIHIDSIKKGDKVFIIDDLLATGGTALAAAKLVEELGGEVVGFGFIIELVDLKGREILKNYPVYSMLKYEGE